MTKRKKFNAEFKREAVRLLETSQKQPSDLARELGVRRNQLYKWKDQLSRRGERKRSRGTVVGRRAATKRLDCARS